MANNKNDTDQVQLPASLIDDSLNSDPASGCHKDILVLRGPMVQEKLQI